MRIEWEGPAPRVLFICAAGLLRAPTAALITAREHGWNTRAAGIMDYALISVTPLLLAWAERVVVMEQDHKRLLCERFPALHLEETVEVLGISDKFRRLDPELEKLILGCMAKA